MSGRDMMGVAKTGSGKTLAFLVPVFRHVMGATKGEDGDGPVAVLMTPTRELALQTYSPASCLTSSSADNTCSTCRHQRVLDTVLILAHVPRLNSCAPRHDEAKKFAKALGLVVACVYGGINISVQISELRRGCDIIVCTPGRMIDMLTVNSGRVTNVRRTTLVVLDEADRMFDLGFEPQVYLLDPLWPSTIHLHRFCSWRIAVGFGTLPSQTSHCYPFILPPLTMPLIMSQGHANPRQHSPRSTDSHVFRDIPAADGGPCPPHPQEAD